MAYQKTFNLIHYSVNIHLLKLFDAAKGNALTFSVVLFRSDFVLISEMNHMKTRKNQYVRTMSCSPECLAGATNRGPTMAPEAQTPSQ
jgi:hypothetical protein